MWWDRQTPCSTSPLYSLLLGACPVCITPTRTCHATNPLPPRGPPGTPYIGHPMGACVSLAVCWSLSPDTALRARCPYRGLPMLPSHRDGPHVPSFPTMPSHGLSPPSLPHLASISAPPGNHHLSLSRRSPPRPKRPPHAGGHPRAPWRWLACRSGHRFITHLRHALLSACACDTYMHCCSEGGFFKMKMTFPVDYPVKPPKLAFLTEVWHPNGRSAPKLCVICPTN